MANEWTLYVRDAQYRRVAQIDDFQKLDTVQKFNDVGTWILEMDARLPAASMLHQPSYGIVLYKGSTAVFSGDVDKISGRQSLDRYRVQFSGYDDTLWLKARLGHPEPATATQPYTSIEYDVRGPGPASTVLIDYVNANLGPGAIATRRHAGLTMAADPLIGSIIQGRVRWTELLKTLQEYAVSGGDIGFRIVQAGSGLQFQVYQPVDRSASVKFSFELGNLLEGAYETSAPTANFIYIGGGGEGLSRIIGEGYDPTSVINWRRRELFADRRDTSVSAELNQTIVENLAEHDGQYGITLTPIDTPGQEYITHYQMGDRVSAVLNQTQIVDVLRELKVTFDPSGPTKVNPMIGTTGATNPATANKTFKSIKTLVRRLSNLEGRR